MNEDIDGKNYPPFIINRGLSFMQDTIHFANIMNRFSALDKQQQHDFYFYGIRKKKLKFLPTFKLFLIISV
jgi:hypothetical protein